MSEVIAVYLCNACGHEMLIGDADPTPRYCPKCGSTDIHISWIHPL